MGNLPVNSKEVKKYILNVENDLEGLIDDLEEDYKNTTEGIFNALFTLMRHYEQNKSRVQYLIHLIESTLSVKTSKELKALAGQIIDLDNKVNALKLKDRIAIREPLNQIVFVVSSKHPKPDLLLLDKQLAFAEFLHIKPVIVLNKIDLDDKNEFLNIQKIYEEIGYKVIQTDAKNGIGVEEILLELKNNISAFAGNSGVGKSTLINDLFKENVTQEGEISQKNKRGKNTTTDICLYELDTDTYIADTPGFSTFDVYEIPYRELDKYFREFKNCIDKCRYVGCSHIKEDECGIKLELEQGKIAKSRYDNYVKIYSELKDKEEHKW